MSLSTLKVPWVQLQSKPRYHRLIIEKFGVSIYFETPNGGKMALGDNKFKKKKKDIVYELMIPRE
jgi:hypothetical protein